MRNAFSFLPSRYECGSVPFSPIPSIFAFFSLGERGGNYLNDLKFIVPWNRFSFRTHSQDCSEGRVPCAEHQKQKADKNLIFQILLYLLKNSQNHRLAGVEGDLKDDLVPTPPAVFSSPNVNTPVLKYIYGIMQSHGFMPRNIKF